MNLQTCVSNAGSFWRSLGLVILGRSYRLEPDARAARSVLVRPRRDRDDSLDGSAVPSQVGTRALGGER